MNLGKINNQIGEINSLIMNMDEVFSDFELKSGDLVEVKDNSGEITVGYLSHKELYFIAPIGLIGWRIVLHRLDENGRTYSNYTYIHYPVEIKRVEV